jgi:hypothetical protein
MQHLEDAIRQRAYHLWIEDGQPEGNADAYWLSAQREILTMSLESAAVAPTASATAKPAKKAKVAAPKKSKRAA